MPIPLGPETNAGAPLRCHHSSRCASSGSRPTNMLPAGSSGWNRISCIGLVSPAATPPVREAFRVQLLADALEGGPLRSGELHGRQFERCERRGTRQVRNLVQACAVAPQLPGRLPLRRTPPPDIPGTDQVTEAMRDSKYWNTITPREEPPVQVGIMSGDRLVRKYSPWVDPRPLPGSLLQQAV